MKGRGLISRNLSNQSFFQAARNIKLSLFAGYASWRGSKRTKLLSIAANIHNYFFSSVGTWACLLAIPCWWCLKRPKQLSMADNIHYYFLSSVGTWTCLLGIPCWWGLKRPKQLSMNATIIGLLFYMTDLRGNSCYQRDLEVSY